MIKKIHRLWFGKHEMPENYKNFGRMWQEINPDWQVIDHGNELLEKKWINQKVIDNVLQEGMEPDADQVAMYTQLADIISYEIIYKHGGLYLNTDIQPIKPLSTLFQMHSELSNKVMVSKEDDYWIVNAILWSPDIKNSFWKEVIDGLENRYYTQPSGNKMNETTGPHLLTDISLKTKKEIFILNKNYFNPIHFSQVISGRDAEFITLPDETIAVHHWGHRKNNRGHKVLNR